MTPSINLHSIYLLFVDFIKQEAFGIILAVGLIIVVGRIVSGAADRYIQHDQKKHAIKKWTRYITAAFIVLWILILYNSHVQRDTPFYLFLIGVFLAGIALSMRDVFSNVVGWMVIVSTKGFKNGDRIKIGSVTGDVIDIGILRTIIAEIGDWVEADQSTGRLISMPNSMVLSHEVCNYTQGYDLIWDEMRVLTTFESNWQKAEKIMNDIALVDFNQKKEQIQELLRKVKSKYMLRFNYISPKVYVSIKDSGVELALRYMVRARRRRTLEDSVTREILTRFNNEKDIEFAYPTIRVYKPDGLIT